MRWIWLSIFTAGLTAMGLSQSAAGAAPAAQTYVSESVLEERIFPFIAELKKDKVASAGLREDAELNRLAAQRWAVANDARKNCEDNAGCIGQALRFTPDQIEAGSGALRRLYRQNPALKEFAAHVIQHRGRYALDATDNESKVLADNWTRSALAMNYIIATYCEGSDAHYPHIDNMLYPKQSKELQAIATVLVSELSVEDSTGRPGTLFFEPALRFSLRLLEANMRDEAGRFSPLNGEENAEALRFRSEIDWKKYRYSVILVPGAGPETEQVSISALGKERVRLAWLAWKSGAAPYILVSGGYVHPAQTPYCEAIEMRRYLEESYGVPANAILIESYARHTTTNLRNASRMIEAYGLPIDKPMLLVSDVLQTDYIASDYFHARNRQELGYEPVIFGKRLSDTQMEIVPQRKSEFADPADPLDP